MFNASLLIETGHLLICVFSVNESESYPCGVMMVCMKCTLEEILNVLLLWLHPAEYVHAGVSDMFFAES